MVIKGKTLNQFYKIFKIFNQLNELPSLDFIPILTLHFLVVTIELFLEITLTLLNISLREKNATKNRLKGGEVSRMQHPLT